MRFYKKYFKGDDLRPFLSGHSRKRTKEGMPEDEARRLVELWARLTNLNYRLDESSVVEEGSSVLLTSGVLYLGADTPEARAIWAGGSQPSHFIENGPHCPKCGTRADQTACYKLVTHYCANCSGWFIAEGHQTPTIQPEKPPSQAEREILPNMKLTVKRTDLIASLSASRDKIQNDHNAAVQAFNDAQASIRTLVDANKAGVANRNGLALDQLNEAHLKGAVNAIAQQLGLPHVAPVLPTSIAQLNTWIGKLNLASDETLELEDTSPYLQYIS